VYETKLRTVGILKPQEVVSVDMPRARFMEIVEATLADFAPLTDELLPVAATMPRFPMSEWQHTERGCGCVVGEYLIATSELSRAELANNEIAKNAWCDECYDDEMPDFVTVDSLLNKRPDSSMLFKFGCEIDHALRSEIWGCNDAENGFRVESIEIID
jgi:hypothetical protein